MIGVTPIDFDICSSVCNTCGWFLYCNDSKLYSGSLFNYSCKDINLSKVNNEIIL